MIASGSVKVFLAHGLKRMPHGEQCGAIGEMSEVILMSTSDRSLRQKPLKAPHEKTEGRHGAVFQKHKSMANIQLRDHMPFVTV